MFLLLHYVLPKLDVRCKTHWLILFFLCALWIDAFLSILWPNCRTLTACISEYVFHLALCQI
jgi:hypothetical protein